MVVLDPRLFYTTGPCRPVCCYQYESDIALPNPFSIHPSRSWVPRVGSRDRRQPRGRTGVDLRAFLTLHPGWYGGVFGKRSKRKWRPSHTSCMLKHATNQSYPRVLWMNSGPLEEAMLRAPVLMLPVDLSRLSPRLPIIPCNGYLHKRSKSFSLVSFFLCWLILLVLSPQLQNVYSGFTSSLPLFSLWRSRLTKVVAASDLCLLFSGVTKAALMTEDSAKLNKAIKNQITKRKSWELDD
jgi:hypothetical protein